MPAAALAPSRAAVKLKYLHRKNVVNSALYYDNEEPLEDYKMKYY
jgi:hypothetical protein